MPPHRDGTPKPPSITVPRGASPPMDHLSGKPRPALTPGAQMGLFGDITPSCALPTSRARVRQPAPGTMRGVVVHREWKAGSVLHVKGVGGPGDARCIGAKVPG